MAEPVRSLSSRFGKFDLRTAERRLLVNGEPVELGARAFDMLVALVERADLGNPKAEPVPEAEYLRMRAQSVAS